MTDEKKKGGLISQILVAVIITLLAGSTAPWWWNELKAVFVEKNGGKPPHPIDNGLGRALVDYETVQAIYSRSKTPGTCVDFRRIIEQMRVYTGNKEPVPESFQYSIRYPSKKRNPTITDLVVDRVHRVKQVNSQCF